MDWQVIAAAFGSIILLILSALYGKIVSDMRKLDASMNAHAVAFQKRFDELPDRYLRRDDFGNFREEMRGFMTRIEQGLAGKVDKH